MGVYTSAESPFSDDGQVKWWEKYVDPLRNNRALVKEVAGEIDSQRLKLENQVDSSSDLPRDLNAQLIMAGGVDGLMFSRFLSEVAKRERDEELHRRAKNERSVLSKPGVEASVSVANIRKEIRIAIYCQMARSINLRSTESTRDNAKSIAQIMHKKFPDKIQYEIGNQKLVPTDLPLGDIPEYKKYLKKEPLDKDQMRRVVVVRRESREIAVKLDNSANRIRTILGENNDKWMLGPLH